METTGQLSPSSNNQSFDVAKARVVTRAFGIRLGGFGVDYTSKQVTVDPPDRPAASKRDTARQSFDTQMERERLREQLLGGSASDSGSQAQAQSASTHPDPVWRRGLAAYAKARDMVVADTLRSAGTTLAVA